MSKYDFETISCKIHIMSTKKNKDKNILQEIQRMDEGVLFILHLPKVA